MSQLFDQLQQHYCSLTAEITAKLSQAQQLGPVGTVGKRKAIKDAVDKLFNDVTDTLDHLELLIRDINADVRPKFASQVDHLRNDANRLQSEAQNILSPSYAERAMRDELYDDDSVASSRLLTDDKRQQYTSELERLENTNRKLEDTYKISMETESIGAEVLQNLSRQREVISGAHTRLRQADEDLSASGRVLTRMFRRAAQSRIFLLVVVVVLAVIIIFSIYLFATRK